MATMLAISVPEAASSTATIQFKITISTVDSTPLPSPFATPLFRSFQQVNWLHTRLVQSLPELTIPPLPDPPNANLVEDQDYVEQKRLQVERFLVKVGRRPEIIAHGDVRYFLSSEMSHTDAVDARKGPVLGFLNQIIKPNYDRGFKTYRPSEPIEENDQDEFQRRQLSILVSEGYFTDLLDHLKELVKQREIFGDDLSVLGDSATEALAGAHLMGAGVKIDNSERHRVLDVRVQVFGRVMDEMGFVLQRQGKAELYYLGDVFQEWMKMLDSVKVVMNARTEKLIDYVNVIKQRNRKREKADKLKLKMVHSSADVQFAIEEEEMATEDVNAVKQAYAETQQNVIRELAWLEEEKSRDLHKALHDYALANMRYERQKLETLQRALGKIGGIEEGPEAQPRLFENPPKRTSSLPDASAWRRKEAEAEARVEVLGEGEGTARSAPESIMAAGFAVSPFARLGDEQSVWEGRRETLNIGLLDVSGL